MSSKVIPPKDPLDADPITTTVRLGKRLLQQVDSIAQEEDRSRSDVIAYLLKWAIREHRNDQKALPK